MKVTKRKKTEKFVGYFMSLILILTLILVSCEKEEDTMILTDDEVSSVVGSSLSPSEGGTAMNVEQSATVASVVAVPSYCGLQKDTTITITGPLGRYTLTSNWSFTLNCVSSVPSSITIVLSGNSSYNGINFDMTATQTGNGTLTNLLSGTNYIYNGTFGREGNSTTNYNGKTKTFSSTLNYTFTNVNIDKTTKKIVSGTATFVFTGQGSEGGSISRTGTITFNANYTATITLDNSEEYTINL
ncbi:MAG: hypothetical protein JXA68_11305 [Ignavibacteriales bacterium]|nr:hypothetical protein [Ignavibacteriales bacterium]